MLSIYRISPDRKTEDDDSDTAHKPTKKAKTAPTPEPKKSASKSNTQTPMMSRLSTLRNMPKRGSPAPSAKPTVASGKSTPVSSKSSPTLTFSKSANVQEKKMVSATSEHKVVSSSSEAKPIVSVKRTAKNESVNVQKISPVAKTTKKVVNNEIRIVNISDIMKQTNTKAQVSDDVKSAKKQKFEPKEDEIIDIEAEISVSSAIRPTRLRTSVFEKIDTKPKPHLKATPSPSNVQKQLSPVMGQKRKLTVNSPPNMASKPTPKPTPTLVSRSKPQTNKSLPPSKMRKSDISKYKS